MTTEKFRLKAVLIKTINGKRSQATQLCTCLACGCQEFIHAKSKNRYVQMTCARCGQRLSIGMVVLNTLDVH